MTRADRILLALVICALPFLYKSLWYQGQPASHLQLQTGNQAAITAPLSPDRRLRIPGPLGDSVIETSRGQARFLSSPCRGQVCVHTGWLQSAGEIAACLPNRISMTLLGSNRRFDAVNF